MLNIHVCICTQHLDMDGPISTHETFDIVFSWEEWLEFKPTFVPGSRKKGYQHRTKARVWTHRMSSAFGKYCTYEMKGCVLSFQTHHVNATIPEKYIVAIAKCSRKTCTMYYHFTLLYVPNKGDARFVVA